MIDSEITQIEIDNSGGHSTPGGNAMAASTGAGSAGDMTYDPNGNLKSYDGSSYTYDAQNRMTAADNNSTGRHIRYHYDPLNRVIAWDRNNAVTVNVWDNWDLLEERAGGDAVQASYIHGAATNEMVMRFAPGQGGHVWYFQDGRGNVSHLANDSNYVIERYTYDVYGAPTYYDGNNTLLGASAYDNRFLFEGSEYLPDLSMYDMRNRIYYPGIGRFLQTDPAGFQGDRSNLYRYCGNDPVNRTDPTGMIPERSYNGSITVERQVLMTITGSWIPQWVTVASATFDVTFTTSGNFSNPDTKSHYQNNLTVKDRFTHERVTGAGRTDTSVTVVPLKGSNTLNADLHVDWWIHTRAAEKDPNLANLEKWHAFGNGSNVKGLLEKGGFWDTAQREIGSKYTAPLHIPSASWAAYWLRMDLESKLGIARSAQIMAWDQKGAAHDYPKF
jgi:RHS repeat-associated protein